MTEIGPRAAWTAGIFALTLLAGGSLACSDAVAWSADGESVTERIASARRAETVLSPTYSVDRKYKSMMGPASVQNIDLGSDGEPELLWITGYEAVMVGADGTTPMAQEFMCHSNLDLDLDAHEKLLGINPGFGSRLFTLSQGQLSVRFPDGFGIPVLSTEPLSLATQVLNHNFENQTFEVRHRVSVEYVRDREVGEAMKALFPSSAYGLALLEGDAGYFGVEGAEEEHHGPGCLVADNASDHEYDDGLGRKFSGHWVVPPGRQVNRTLVTHLMRIPYDTTLHYIAVHLHPFAESLELHDLTTGEMVFQSTARNFPDRIGLAHVDSLSSARGVPVYADHEYEIVSTYHNTTDENQDSMAVMYLYLRDQQFEERWASRRHSLLQAAP